jgi:hypothetical protein
VDVVGYGEDLELVGGFCGRGTLGGVGGGWVLVFLVIGCGCLGRGL